jgi:cobalt-zinc-cadmium efflux system membrane fusion protein
LAGPEAQNSLTQAQGAVRSAAATLAAAQQALAVSRRQENEYLATRQSVLQAEAAASEAQARLAAAKAQLQATQTLLTLSSPEAGTVLAVNAADGERVSAGDTIMVIEPVGRLWVRAAFYGKEARSVLPGMTGRFQPDDGAPSVPVRVAAVSPGLTPDGGEFVGLSPIGSSSGWKNGETGTVRVAGPSRAFMAVPTRALVLDQGKWWVVLKTPQGLQPREVIPGPSRGWDTLIERGLAPDAQVVVTDAFLQFHRGISSQYQPPND